MPCFNGAACLRESIASALAQTYREIELIVIDDGSTDESPKILSESNDSRIRVLTQSHSGVCVARNRGLRTARGEFVAFLDADDAWHPACLERLHAALEKEQDVALAYCGWQNLGLPGPRGEPFIPPNYERPDKIATLIESCRWPIHAALTRQTAIAQAGSFDERYATSEDFFFWLKIACKSKICLVPEVLAYYHHHLRPRATDDSLCVARNHWLVQKEFLRLNPDILQTLGLRKARELTDGLLLKNAYVRYWKRDLLAARELFRLVMKTGYGDFHDWLYMLPALLPMRLYRLLIETADRVKN
jgi:glycosyltransferase involved in cell wall biosynthesis